jgi:hypothetical protein
MKDKKKKKGVAVIISIGPKMPKKPMDAATPDMKKYGSMPMKKTWQTLKALPEHQMFSPAYDRANLAEDTYEGDGIDVGERQRGEGTIHPAIYGMMQRRMKENPHLTSGSYNQYEPDLPNLNLTAMREYRKRGPAHFERFAETPMIDGHPERYADSMPYGSLTDDPMDAYANKQNRRRTKAPQTYSYERSHPMKKAWSILKNEKYDSDYPPMSTRRTPRSSPFRFMNQNNYTRDSMPPPSRYDDEGFGEYDMEDMGPPYGKPEFGDEDARQAEMNEAERAAIMAEGMPEMRKPRGAPRPGDPRFADPNKPRPRIPKDVFANR